MFQRSSQLARERPGSESYYVHLGFIPDPADIPGVHRAQVLRLPKTLAFARAMRSIPTHDFTYLACFVTFPSSEELASVHALGSAASGTIPDH